MAAVRRVRAFARQRCALSVQSICRISNGYVFAPHGGERVQTLITAVMCYAKLVTQELTGINCIINRQTMKSNKNSAFCEFLLIQL